MDKAIEIKRRAQRCIQNGDMDGALAEYEKLVAIEDADPYNFVLLADLHYKRGDQDHAVQRYLAAVAAYEKTTLYKNAIAVCKKMMRLSLAPSKVLERLASLHALDGLGTEAALFYMQYAEAQVRDQRPLEAAEALRKAFEACPEEIKALERMSEAYVLGEKAHEAAQAMGEAAYAYAGAGRHDHARRCRTRAEQLERGIMAALAAERGPVPGLSSADDSPSGAPAPQVLNVPGAPHADDEPASEDAGDAAPAMVADDVDWEPRRSTIPSAPATTLEGLETGLAAFRGEKAPADAAPPALEMPEAEDASDDEPEPEIDAPGIPALVVNDERASEDADAADDPVPDSESEPEPAYEVEVEDEPAVASGRAAGGAAPRSATATMAQIEELLNRAQAHFRAGERDAAGERLIQAALAYEAIDRHENAASIFRSLGRGTSATPALLEHWLNNCVRRNDAREAAEVACELGDRAVSDGDVERARGWFEQAVAHDPDNAVATRRLQRLAQINPPAPGASSPARRKPSSAPLPAVERAAAPGAAPPPASAPGRGTTGTPARPPAPAPARATTPTPAPARAATPTPRPAPPAPPADGETGRVEMAVGRAEAVTFDLGSLLAEFQRGIEAQLSGDAQSHYDLAMTYREMGLVDQALDAFRMAAADPAFAPRAAEMMGRCLLDQGRFEEATHEFMIALDAPDMPAEAEVGLRYHLGLALEAAGKLREAMQEFERVFAMQANYSDVALKLRTMRKALEAA